MEKILKRVQDYTYQEFEAYCIKNGLDLNMYKCAFREWAIECHECDLMKVVNDYGYMKPVLISGVVGIARENHQIKPKQMHLGEGINAVLTPDTQDYSILKGSQSSIYVSTVHALGHNLFRIKFLDD